jgi:hypothetical protein
LIGKETDFSLSLAGYYLSLILNDHGKVVSNEEVHVECDPLSDLIHANIWEIIIVVHPNTIDRSDTHGEYASIDVWVY